MSSLIDDLLDQVEDFKFDDTAIESWLAMAIFVPQIPNGDLVNRMLSNDDDVKQFLDCICIQFNYGRGSRYAIDAHNALLVDTNFTMSDILTIMGMISHNLNSSNHLTGYLLGDRLDNGVVMVAEYNSDAGTIDIKVLEMEKEL